MTTPPPDSNPPLPPEAPNTEPTVPTFTEQMAPLLAPLLYPSESDEPILALETYLSMTEPLTVSHIKDWLMLPPATDVAEQPEADFWAPVITVEDWFGEEERATAAQFQQLKTRLEATLSNRQVFRVGQTEIDLYLLGTPANGPRAGLKTKVVET